MDVSSKQKKHRNKIEEWQVLDEVDELRHATTRMSVDVVDEQAQWMAENSSAPPTMDTHVLTMDLPLRCSYTALPPTSPRVKVEHPMKRDQNQRVV